MCCWWSNHTVAALFCTRTVPNTTTSTLLYWHVHVTANETVRKAANSQTNSVWLSQRMGQKRSKMWDKCVTTTAHSPSNPTQHCTVVPWHYCSLPNQTTSDRPDRRPSFGLFLSTCTRDKQAHKQINPASSNSSHYDQTGDGLLPAALRFQSNRTRELAGPMRQAYDYQHTRPVRYR